MTEEVILTGITSDPKNVELVKECYENAMKNEWESIKTMYRNCRFALYDGLTLSGDTVFHIAASKGSIELLQALFEMVPTYKKWDVVMMEDIYGNTLLHEAATSNKVDAAKFLVENAHGERLTMLTKPNNSGETPMYRAAAFGIKATVEYMANEVEKEMGSLQAAIFTKTNDNLSILQIAIINENFETAIWLLDRDLDQAMLKDSKEKYLHFLASMSTVFKSSSKKMSVFKEFIYRYIPNDLHYRDETDHQHVPRQCYKARKDYQPMIEMNFIKEIVGKKRKHELACKLAKTLVQRDTSSWRQSLELANDPVLGMCNRNARLYNRNVRLLRDEETVGEEESKASTKTRGQHVYVVSPSNSPLIIAASTGILEIVKMIHKEYPQALEHVTPNGQNILHVAILCRQYHIFEYIKEKGGAVNSELVLQMDNQGETILHKAARTNYYQGGTKPTVALNLQDELKWFKKVKKMVPLHYTIHLSSKNYTAKELFKDQHQEQLKNAQEWVKNTCQSCSAVSVLVATVIFTSAFTAPGGFNGYGRPVLEERPLYSFFTVMDEVGLASSLTSVVLFLSVLTSSLDLKDFANDIPRKLSFGFLFLSFAILTTMLSFTAAIILTVHLKKPWNTTLTFIAASLPIGVYAIVQFDLYMEYFKIALTSIYEFVKKFILRR
ncbi:hypothetical protein SLEP1_g3974 [Rubroshorea leprosula]|uniref:PGG domain-containing protein n=1 Tax=Rubroshorea leprosula TaxID=152421 RepID=A0AAV5HM79_9ROSI|nr:hypothetical protein SLEP1_g3974 [Rubroshorea leprosula]